MADEFTAAAPAAAPEPASASTPSTETPTPSIPSTGSGSAETPSEAPRRIDETLREVAAKVFARENPNRAGDGKFMSRDAPDQAAPALEISDQPTEQEGEPAEPAIDPPRSWSAEMQAKFTALPPDVRNYVAERDKEVFRQVSQMGAQLKATEPIRTALEEQRDYLQRIGRKPEDAIKLLFNASRSLDTNPAATLRKLADMYRVDLRQLALSPQPAPVVARPDPQQEARLRRLEAEIQQRTEAEQEARRQAVASTVERFAQANPDFQLLEPAVYGYTQELRELNPDMGPEEVLAEAYKLAVRDTEQILTQRQKATEAKRKAEQEKQIKEARRHSSINQSSNGKGATPARGSVRDSLERHARRLMG